MRALMDKKDHAFKNKLRFQVAINSCVYIQYKANAKKATVFILNNHTKCVQMCVFALKQKKEMAYVTVLRYSSAIQSSSCWYTHI